MRRSFKWFARSLTVLVSTVAAVALVASYASALAGSSIDPGRTTAGSITLAGDVTGAGNANTLAKIAGTPVSISGPQQFQVIAYDGANWTNWTPLGLAKHGNCTLNGGSPSSCTADLGVSNADCTCANVGSTAALAAQGCAVSVSGTSVTITSANGASNSVSFVCSSG